MRKFLLGIVAFSLLMGAHLGLAQIALDGANHCSAYAAGPITTASCSLSNVSAGDLITVEFADRNGWVTTVSDSRNGAYTQVYYAPDSANPSYAGIAYFANSAAGALTVTVTLSNSASIEWPTLSVQAWKGVASSGPLDSTAVTQYQASTSGTVANASCGASETPSGPGELILGYLVTDNVSASAGANYTLSDAIANTFPEYWIQSTAQSTNAPFVNSADDWIAGCAAFKPASNGGGGGGSQTITGGGTANTIPLFTGSSTLGNSVITQSGSNVGIGTTTASFPLTVNGTASASAYCISGANCITSWPAGPGGSSQWTNSGSSIYYNSGNVGIGTTTPAAMLDVAGTQTLQNQAGGDYLLNYGLGASLEDPNTGDIVLLIPASTGVGVNGSQFAGIIQSNRGSSVSWNLNSQWYVSVQSAYTNNTGSILPLSGQQEYSTIPTLITCVYNGTTYIGFQTPTGNSLSQWSLTGNYSNGQSAQKPIMVSKSAVTNISTLVGYESVGSQISIVNSNNPGNTGIVSDNVGIGTTSPAYNLDVAGITRAQQGVIYPDGNKQMTAWTGVLCGGDYAEAVNAKGSRKTYEPGDVLVLGDGIDGEVQKSAEPYSTMVAGIFATKPGVIGKRQSLLKDADEIPMAMVGIVPTKVTTENGPIHRGDLLVTSSTAGYAMKGADRSRMLGAVIGKAMGSLEFGEGVIEVLVALQ